MPHREPIGDNHQKLFIEWMEKPEVGCGFARSFAKRPEEAGLQGITLMGANLGTTEIQTLNELLAQACSRSEAVYVLFPDINTVEEVTSLIQALCGTPAWKCIELTVDCPRVRQTLVIGLRWFLPDAKHMNYVLGFANLPDMPRTRRAPITALMFGTGLPGRAPGLAFAHGAHPKEDLRASENPPIPVHLADMPDLLPTEQSVAALWAQTTKLKRAQLQGDAMAEAAKAKITFCLPASTREVLRNVIVDNVSLGPGLAMG